VPRLAARRLGRQPRRAGGAASAASGQRRPVEVGGGRGEVKIAFGLLIRMRQRLGDRYGEGATLYQLGQLAFQVGAKTDGVRLVVMGFLIIQAIGHGEAQNYLANLLGLCQQLGYNEDQVQSVVQETAEAYQQDAGWGLLARAFDRLPPETA
jgi:hypothetical protein